MTETRVKATRADFVHEKLRADILAGRVEPGERLKSAELCRRYETSVGAAREALNRLQAEGLVQSRPHVGYIVTPLSERDLSELTQARVEIESLVLGLSIQNGDVAWEGQVIAAFHVMERTPFMDADDPGRISDQWAAAHADFHFALLAACPNARLAKLARSLREESSLYQLWSVSFKREPARDGLGEHRAILKAAVDRNVPLAGELLRDHIQHTTRLLIIE
ncbi:GntR family transcriptional regulator [Rhodococcus sp. ACPA1]|uniref:GntR family transcriptional regulator n=1 Tax=Rhodococcus sp. ACPA1 TaxID=2028572 RepID=UPI000BB110BB|nr:GntR family transcriptional regulator [Rhodococcus sp. ACPA1]PBC47180.1 GntR family transcriptional regulator [Rhodococcus sp. ACPA1]